MEFDKDILEHRLMESLKNGSVRAFNDIFRLYAGKLLAYVSSATKSKEDAEEIVHDIFLNVWNRRHSIDSSRSLASLLFSIAYKKRVDYYRHIVRMPIFEDYINLQNELAEEENSRMEYRDFYKMVDKAIRRLPERYRDVVVLSRFRGMTNAEIARQLGISEKTVRNILSLALKQLRQILKDLQ